MGILITFLVMIAGVFAIYFINIALIRTQLEELTHRHKRGDSLSGDVEEWEYYLNKLFWKPFGTKKTLLTYGPHFEDYMKQNYPHTDSDVLKKVKKLQR
ncbi:hypothetical protein HXA34_04395 [Salipaludibacillus agaradhaerens]|uniref:Uncharacterized protein n=1 Tax=Salipaludibacillus agaradhaerens TaxID=76935 RepID=A0A9Q4FYG4_SALAG|nr:hypothetical protein [Salipaludibacillus agaradhaerens]MCR6097635.1 hypothetical protein [Salipaludibacillus agaradhaerens]MCR6105524.1 hypothetical protein [Salipaludibacillus agaradhaerens]MCR6112881.1 hypothetical protein [Salipaludibacillus agaradhaerens]MCR6117562.1 hypothetical protein [Salipaludibacillus agaradhaerens]